MTYTVHRPHRWVIVVYENDEHLGVVTKKSTGRIKWFKSQANANKFINRYFKVQKQNIKLVPEIDDYHEYILKEVVKYD